MANYDVHQLRFGFLLLYFCPCDQPLSCSGSKWIFLFASSGMRDVKSSIGRTSGPRG